MNEKKVELIGWLQNPKLGWGAEDYAVAGAMGCFSELSSSDIHGKYSVSKELYRDKYSWDETKELILKETSGRGHGAVLDQSCFAFSIENLTRASTLFLCAPEYANHLQQSLRRATADRGFSYLEKVSFDTGVLYFESLEDIPPRKLMEEQFELYERMQSSGVPGEDARFILPLYTKTNIQTILNARELNHLHAMSKRKGVPPEVTETCLKMYLEACNVAPDLLKNRETNYESLAWFPSSQLFARQNKLIDKLSRTHLDSITLLDYSKLPMDKRTIRKAIEKRDETELANLKHYHFTFLVPMSLATFHQATRQRTWNQSVQTLRSAVQFGDYVIPTSIANSEFNEKYRTLVEKSFDFVRGDLKNPVVYGVLPHALQVYDLIHINGWNAIHSIGKRTCTEAQWEIRKCAREMAKKIKEVAPELGEFSVPQGIIYGKCPEKNSCGVCDKK